MTNVNPITRSIELDASPEVVFDAYTNKQHLEKWFAETAEINLTDGGEWRIEWPGGMAAEGHVIEASRPDRYVWTWEKSIGRDPEGNEWAQPSMVTNTYIFTDIGDGRTRFDIEESGHDSQEARDMSEGGVDQMLGTLRAFVEDGVEIDWKQATDEMRKAMKDAANQ